MLLANVMQRIGREYRPALVWARLKTWRPDWLEGIGIVGTVISTVWFLWLFDWHWQAWIMAAAMIVAGYLSGDVIYRIWGR